jgi:hypothetical protein
MLMDMVLQIFGGSGNYTSESQRKGLKKHHKGYATHGLTIPTAASPIFMTL